MSADLIRLNALIGPLADEMLDQIPLIDGAVYCDPAMGAGQIVARIEARLRSAGYSNAYIRTHVFGYGANEFDVEYAVNKHKLVGTYEVKTLDELQSMMKQFDVILINPPYQDGSREAGAAKNKTKLWPKFFELTKQLIKPDGYVGFISPTSWMSPSKESFVKTKILTALTTDLDLQVALFGLTQKHFRGVGVDIGAVVYQNRSYQGVTKIGNETFDLSGMFFIPKSTEAMDIKIMRKIVAKNGPRFTFKHLSTGAEYQTKLHSSGRYAWLPSLMNAKIEYSDSKPPENAYYGVPKIHMDYQTGGRCPKFTVDSIGKYAVRHNGHIDKMYPTSIAHRILTDIFNHKLVKFMMRNQWSQFVEPRIASLIPQTDQDLYVYFGLTKAEIAYVESQIA